MLAIEERILERRTRTNTTSPTSDPTPTPTPPPNPPPNPPPGGGNSNWWRGFLRSVFSPTNYKQATSDAIGKGYYDCLEDELLPAFLKHGASWGTTKTTEHSARILAGTYYHFTDARFTAWGTSSKVMVPNLASKVAYVAEGADVIGWAFFDAEIYNSIYECSGTLQ